MDPLSPPGASHSSIIVIFIPLTLKSSGWGLCMAGPTAVGTVLRAVISWLCLFLLNADNVSVGGAPKRSHAYVTLLHPMKGKLVAPSISSRAVGAKLTVSPSLDPLSGSCRSKNVAFDIHF